MNGRIEGVDERRKKRKMEEEEGSGERGKVGGGRGASGSFCWRMITFLGLIGAVFEKRTLYALAMLRSWVQGCQVYSVAVVTPSTRLPFIMSRFLQSNKALKDSIPEL